jgi:hypothetical protein
MPRIHCPWPGLEAAWIEYPDIWLGEHAARRDKAIREAEEYDSETITSFAAAIALLDNWSLPGMDGNPEKWDFLKLDLRLLAWVPMTVFPSFNKCWEVPKNFLSPSPIQSMAAEETE